MSSNEIEITQAPMSGGTSGPGFSLSRKTLAVWSAIVVLLLFGVFMAGRYSRPARIVTTEKITEVRHEQTVVQQKVDISELKQLLRDQSKKSDVVVTREIIRNVDGSSREVIRKEDKSTTSSYSTSTSAVVAKKETVETKKVDSARTEERVQDVTNASAEPPKWSLGLSAGVSVPALFGSDVPSFVPGLPRSISIGLQLDRKLIGPLFIGARLDSRAEFGIVLGIRR